MDKKNWPDAGRLKGLTEGQVIRYLERIGLKREAVEQSAEGLDRLIRAHLLTVPFENLDVTEKGIVPSLETDILFEKIVEKRRGGYCFELNRLFCAFLLGLGYEVIPVAVRILLNKPVMPAATHRASLVRIKEHLYLADVGFGGPGPKGVLELTDGVQTVAGVPFSVRSCENGQWKIWRTAGETGEPLFLLEEKEAYEADFSMMNYFCARNEAVVFSHTRVLNLCLEEGSVSLTGTKLTVRDGHTVREEEPKTKEELKVCLKRYFGIELE